MTRRAKIDTIIVMVLSILIITTATIEVIKELDLITNNTVLSLLHIALIAIGAFFAVLVYKELSIDIKENHDSIDRR